MFILSFAVIEGWRNFNNFQENILFPFVFRLLAGLAVFCCLLTQLIRICRCKEDSLVYPSARHRARRKLRASKETCDYEEDMEDCQQGPVTFVIPLHEIGRDVRKPKIYSSQWWISNGRWLIEVLSGFLVAIFKPYPVDLSQHALWFNNQSLKAKENCVLKTLDTHCVDCRKCDDYTSLNLSLA